MQAPAADPARAGTATADPYPVLVVHNTYQQRGGEDAVVEAEDAQIVQAINASGAGTVWVSLGCPKQEQWMDAHRGRVQAVMIGVGAAFGFHAGTVSRAPLWMRHNGLEWLHRLATEPRRLWRRYVVTNTAFMFLAARQLLSGQ